MNIAFFTDTYLPQTNGVVVSVYHFAKELRKKGHTVWIFAPEFSQKIKDDKWTIRLTSIKVLDSKPEVKFPLLVPNENYRKMFSVPIDIIHAHGNGAFSLLAYQIARLRTVPYVLTFHTLFTKYLHYVRNMITPQMAKGIMRMFGNLCDSVITPSVKMKQELKKYGVKKPIQVIPNFINRTDFKVAHSHWIHTHYKIPDDHQIVLTVGRLGKEKNFDFIVRMFAKLHKVRPKTHLLLVGYGPEEQRLHNLIKKLHLQGNVTITGHIDRKKIPVVYGNSDVFVFASKSETQGLTVLEAAAAGIPIVTVDDCAYVHMVEDKRNGFLVKLSIQEFVSKTVELLDDETLRRKMGREGTRLVDEHFQEDVITDQLLELYRDTLTHFSRQRPMYKKLINRETLKILTDNLQKVADFLS